MDCTKEFSLGGAKSLSAGCYEVERMVHKGQVFLVLKGTTIGAMEESWKNLTHFTGDCQVIIEEIEDITIQNEMDFYKTGKFLVTFKH